MGIAVGILVLRALELEICLGGQITPPPNCQQTSQKIIAGTRVKGESVISIKQTMGHFNFAVAIVLRPFDWQLAETTKATYCTSCAVQHVKTMNMLII